MKKLPEILALSIGMGFLSLAGAIAWHSVEGEALSSDTTTLEEDAPTEAASDRALQAGVVASGR